ncbi:hypothetical protein [Tsuneonella sp. HG222]
MDSNPVTASSLETVEATLRDELAQGDAVLSTATPILRHLLVNEDQALFGDEVVARVRGMIGDIARQVLFAHAEASRASDRIAFADQRAEPLVAALANDPALLAHLHALTIEGQLARRLNARTGADLVLSPLLQELVASRDEPVAAAAMSAITAQARFGQQQQRMALPLGELPGDLFHHAMLAFRTAADGEDGAEAAEKALRESFDEGLGRIGLLAHLVMRLGKGAVRALDVDNAGMAIFITALAMASGQSRDTAVLSLSERQFARLALALRAAGLSQAAVEEQFLYLHPDFLLPDGFEKLRADRAAAMLSASPVRAG